MAQVFERMCVDLEKRRKKETQVRWHDRKVGVTEYQVNKLRCIHVNRLDWSNPLAFFEESSTYAFKSGVKCTESPLNLTRLILERGHLPPLRNALKSPLLLSPPLCVPQSFEYWLFQSVLDFPYTRILLWQGAGHDEQAVFSDTRWLCCIYEGWCLDPGMFGVSYLICDKAINQLRGFL